MSKTEQLYSKEFLILNGILFLVAAIMAVFFQFYNYLESLGIPAIWFGFLIGADSLASFFLQPFLAVYLNTRNGRKWMFISVFAMAIVLFSYKFALTPASLTIVRIFHGAAFVCFISAMLAIMVAFIPPKKSAQAFGLVSVVRLLPYSIVPPILKAIDHTPADFQEILMYSALLMILSSGMVFQLKAVSAVGPENPAYEPHLNMGDLRKSITNRDVAVLLIINFLLYNSYAATFFFVKAYGQTRGIENPGFFFTIATAAMIGVRVLGGQLFDKVNKTILTGVCMAGLAVCYCWLFHVSGMSTFYILALLTGLGWGIGIPVLNALMFDISLPHLRSMNINLSLVMMQGGFFVGPFLGGLLAARCGYRMLFYFCGAMSMGGAVLILTTLKRRSQ